MAWRSRAAPKSQGYGVKLVRGPYLRRAPHAEHVRAVDGLPDYAKRFRAEGVGLAVDLFCGAGGLSLGLDDAGLHVVLAADNDKFAVLTHMHHFGGMSVDWDLSDPRVVQEVGDLVRELQVDVLAGGPPCQPFSKAGRSMIRHRVQMGERDPYDERRDLWRSFLEIVQIAEPRAVLMENVPDMALDSEMFILRSMVEELEQLGYTVEARVVDTWRYGVPQFRQRLILVALADGLDFEWPLEAAEKVTVWNAIGDLPEVEGGWRPEGGEYGWADYDGPITSFQKQMRQSVPPEDEAKVFDHITRPVRDDDREAFEKMTHETKYSDLDEKHQRYRSDIFDDKYKRLNENDLSRTITAHIAKDGYWYIHPRQNRTLTVREAARLQTFPDTFRFDGPPSAAFRQIGNAVPPLLGAAMGRGIAAAMERRQPRTKLSSQETSSILANWYNGRSRNLAVPWLRAETRWRFLVGEIVLDRASVGAVRAMWPYINRLEKPSEMSVEDLDATLEILSDMAEGIGRSDRAASVGRLARVVVERPLVIDGPDLDPRALGISAASADMAVLAVPTDRDGMLLPAGEGEEPVLVTKGVLRVARRYSAASVDVRNKLTDGRIAVARMIGLGDKSRDAHKALIELANSFCRPENPLCSQCPIVQYCARDGVDDEVGTPL